MTIKSEILEIVREMGPINARDIMLLMSHQTRSNVTARLSELEARGAIHSESVPDKVSPTGRVKVYRYCEIAPRPKLVKRKLTKPTPIAMAYNETALRQRITELEAWKADAIKRYPDLAVAPEILKARAIALEMLAGERSHSELELIRIGQKDGTVLIRAIVRAFVQGMAE